MTEGKGWAAVLAVVMTCGVTGQVIAEEAAPRSPARFLQQPDWLGPKYVSAADWHNLDALVESLATSGERSTDGRFQLYMLTAAINQWLDNRTEDQDERQRRELAEYDRQFPQSAFPPVLEAMHVHSTAWRARGSGFASTVTPEGWALFRERNAAARKMIQASKARSARLPTWYEWALVIGRDASVPDDELMGLFHEGLERFPGYHPLYFAIERQFSPRWGGNYADADEFINSQVAAKTNPEGEVLYTRLYWLLDQYERGDPEFFEESKVSWSRMRNGFELLMKQFPESTWNHANFAAYACRAGDGATYVKLRPQVNAGQFSRGAPEGISLDVCDARFLQKT